MFGSCLRCYMNRNSFFVVFPVLLVSISPPTSLIYSIEFSVFIFWALIFSCSKAVTAVKSACIGPNCMQEIIFKIRYFEGRLSKNL